MMVPFFRGWTWRVLGGASAAVGVSLVILLACQATPSPFFIVGPSVQGNEEPFLRIIAPTENLSRARGESFQIAWQDIDPDSAALISFTLINATTGLEIVLVQGIPENPPAGATTESPESDSFDASTSAVPVGSYFLRGTIADGINAPFSTFAEAATPGGGRVQLVIAPEGAAPPSRPPIIAAIEPAFNLSVAQDDVLTILLQPDRNAPVQEVPYDPDSDAQIFVLLDFDNDPTNDDVFRPAGADNEIILLGSPTVVPQGDFGAITINRDVDLALIPPRTDGNPYFVRATIVDDTNPPVHAYAPGTVSVVASAAGSVDLGLIGRSVSGATFKGFNPGSRLGSRMISLGDFDADGIDDFLLVARFGNPRNFGNVGEAYLIYGLDQQRFGGFINVNSVGLEPSNTLTTGISGVIFEGPPNRLTSFRRRQGGIPAPAEPAGIFDVSTVRDLDGDGRPELLFGLPLVDGAIQGRDDDPDDISAPSESIRVTLQNGPDGRTRTEDGVNADGFPQDYSGAYDTYLDSTNPSTPFGAQDTILWGGDNDANRRWGLIGFLQVRSTIRDPVETISNLNATLSLTNASVPPFNGTIHDIFQGSEFRSDEQNIETFNSFSRFGGAPLAGPEPASSDYDSDSAGSINANNNVTQTIRQLIDGELTTNDPQWIIVPTGAQENVAFSSEHPLGQPDDDPQAAFRPRLTINYTRTLSADVIGCYRDGLANDRSNTPDDPGFGLLADSTLLAGGMAAMVYSSNRDNDGVINPDRLADTSIALELVGQQTGLVLDGNYFDTVRNVLHGDVRGGAIVALAQGAQPGRVAGARFEIGWYDFVNDQFPTIIPNPLNARFAETVDSLPDINNDQVDEIMISMRRNELDILENDGSAFLPQSHVNSRAFTGSIVVLPGQDYDVDVWRDKNGDVGNSTIPTNRINGQNPGQCGTDFRPRTGPAIPIETFQVFAETPGDFLGGARSAGDFNLDGAPDIVCGAPGNDRPTISDAGAVYILYGRTPTGDIDLRLADDPARRPRMLRIRGETDGDGIGGDLDFDRVVIRQISGTDVNGDRIDDIFLSSPTADHGGVRNASCGAFASSDLVRFSGCRDVFGDEVFLDDSCKEFDFDNDRDIDSDDRDVFDCLVGGGRDCCPVDNGFVGIVFGGRTVTGDRTLSQIGTADLPGTRFFGSSAGNRAGYDISSAGDFNRDSFGDLLIAAPGELRMDAAGQQRLGVVYLIFGGRHLQNKTFNLNQVGTDELPGIVFLSPFTAGRPDEAPPDHVGLLGDVNNDGFSDIAIGNTRADLTDENRPQGSEGTFPGAGRVPDDGDIYIIYGNNTGSNRLP